MAYLWYLGCAIDHHRPLRHTVVWDVVAYTGTCRYCGATIVRERRHSWRKQKVDARTPLVPPKEQPV